MQHASSLPMQVQSDENLSYQSQLGRLPYLNSARPDQGTNELNVNAQTHVPRNLPRPTTGSHISNSAPGAGNTSGAVTAVNTSDIPSSLARPKVTTTLWEDEGTLCFQVEARGVCVARREDNDMINGTKLLNVIGMSRGKRDGILKVEKVRHVIKVGAMHLKGVWIPFERAHAFADKEGIVDLLYPLFIKDIKELLYRPQGGIVEQPTTRVSPNVPGETVPPYPYSVAEDTSQSNADMQQNPRMLYVGTSEYFVYDSTQPRYGQQQYQTGVNETTTTPPAALPVYSNNGTSAHYNNMAGTKYGDYGQLPLKRSNEGLVSNNNMSNEHSENTAPNSMRPPPNAGNDMFQGNYMPQSANSTSLLTPSSSPYLRAPLYNQNQQYPNVYAANSGRGHTLTSPYLSQYDSSPHPPGSRPLAQTHVQTSFSSIPQQTTANVQQHIPSPYHQQSMATFPPQDVKDQQQMAHNYYSAQANNHYRNTGNGQLHLGQHSYSSLPPPPVSIGSPPDSVTSQHNTPHEENNLSVPFSKRMRQ